MLFTVLIILVVVLIAYISRKAMKKDKRKNNGATPKNGDYVPYQPTPKP